MTAFTGVWRVARLVARRDRLRLPLWIGGLTGIVVVSAAALLPTYPDQAAIDSYAALVGDNPALIAFAGPGYGFDDPNIGLILVNEVQLWGCIGVALMSIFLVNRHTRAEEDVERAELLRSSVLGRHAPATAAIGVVAAANLAIAALCAAGFVALGYATVGSLALAASLLAVGWVFVGVALVAAQVAGSGRTTLGLGCAALGAAFVLRAVGDVGDNVARWLSPIGWAQGVRAFAGERWITLVACVVFATGLVIVGLWLSTRRDIGAGIAAQRPGPPRASRWLARSWGLTMRQHRGALIGWVAGMFTVAILYGSMGEDIVSMVEENPIYGDLLAQLEGADVADSFFATTMSMLAMLAAGFAIAAALRPHFEESAGRVESLLATPTSRFRFVLGHLTIAAVGICVLMVAAGLGTGLSYAVVAHDASQITRMVAAALVTVPAILVLAGIAVALFGWWPEGVAVSWAALAVVVVVGLLGEVLNLPEWVRAVSPFEHLPAVPARDVDWLPIVVLLALAAGLAAFGLWGFRRRDLRAS